MSICECPPWTTAEGTSANTTPEYQSTQNKEHITENIWESHHLSHFPNITSEVNIILRGTEPAQGAPCNEAPSSHHAGTSHMPSIP